MVENKGKLYTYSELLFFYLIHMHTYLSHGILFNEFSARSDILTFGDCYSHQPLIKKLDSRKLYSLSVFGNERYKILHIKIQCII